MTVAASVDFPLALSLMFVDGHANGNIRLGFHYLDADYSEDLAEYEQEALRRALLPIVERLLAERVDDR
jgi:hypothetical protein